jgi:nitrate reductase NapD
MNICGCLVLTAPHTLQQTLTAIQHTPGAEVHAHTEDGRVVVVVEDTEERFASETIMQLHQIPGVISLTLTYHHFEEPEPSVSPPATCSSPA